MKIFYASYPKEEIETFINKSTPIENTDFRLKYGYEDAGWADFCFKYNHRHFNILMTLASSDLSDIVEFFENFINLKEKSVTFLDNETISTPLLYAAPADNDKIRFLVADGLRRHDLWYKNKLDEKDFKGIFDYDIRCDVIVSKKKLLKEFYRAVKNIINYCTIYEYNMYDINYPQWKDKLKNIISYIRKDT